MRTARPVSTSASANKAKQVASPRSAPPSSELSKSSSFRSLKDEVPSGKPAAAATVLCNFLLCTAVRDSRNLPALVLLYRLQTIANLGWPPAAARQDALFALHINSCSCGMQRALSCRIDLYLCYAKQVKQCSEAGGLTLAGFSVAAQLAFADFDGR